MVGKVTFEITEREEPKLIKLEAKGLPTKACLWVQILPEGDNLCKMKVTSGIELNFLIKGMVEKYLEPGKKHSKGSCIPALRPIIKHNGQWQTNSGKKNVELNKEIEKVHCWQRPRT